MMERGYWPETDPSNKRKIELREHIDNAKRTLTAMLPREKAEISKTWSFFAAYVEAHSEAKGAAGSDPRANLIAAETVCLAAAEILGNPVQQVRTDALADLAELVRSARKMFLI